MLMQIAALDMVSALSAVLIVIAIFFVVGMLAMVVRTYRTFQITVDNTFLMGSFHTFSNLTADFQGFLNRHWTLGNLLS